MFAKLTSAFTLFAILAAATASPNAAPAGSCSTGTPQCCDSVQPAGSTAVAPILKGLGVVVQDLNVPVGLTCSGIDVVGVGSSSSCSAEAVCCDDTGFGGLVAIGCLPISA